MKTLAENLLYAILLISETDTRSISHGNHHFNIHALLKLIFDKFKIEAFIVPFKRIKNLFRDNDLSK